MKMPKHVSLTRTLSRITAVLLLATSISATSAATNTVANSNDSGAGSLRQAILNSVSGDTIDFNAGLSGVTIVLSNGQFLLNKNLTISASALPGGISISGNNTSRVFQVNAGNVVSLRALTIRDGYAPDGNYPANAGGGILNLGTLTLTNCTIANNQAVLGTDPGGGGIENNSATLTVHNSTISRNSTSAFGGAIENYGDSTLVMNQSTVTGNSSSTGGGIHNEGLHNNVATLTVNQSTLTGNSASIGGGVYNASTLNLFNSVVAGNSAGIGPNINNTDTFTRTGVNLTNGVPLLAPLGNYGGPTRTMPPLPGSPAINAAAATSFTTDQRGFPRLLGPAPDIGAVEGVFNPAMPLTNPTRLSNGSFQFGFTNLSGPSYSVLAGTEAVLPLSTWSNLGAAVEAPPGSGQFQFTDLQATNHPQQYYRVKLP